MSLIESDPQPFIFEEEPMVVCQGKLCEIVANPGEFQGPPLEYMYDEGVLLAFIFNNDFPPITNPAVIPVPSSGLLLVTILLLVVGYKKLSAQFNGE